MKPNTLSTDYRTKRAKVYRDAAELLCHQDTKECWGCCDAINKIVCGSALTDTQQKEEFEHYFKPVSKTLYWGSLWGDDDAFWSGSIHNCRILAICFMAAMVEAGDA